MEQFTPLLLEIKRMVEFHHVKAVELVSSFGCGNVIEDSRHTPLGQNICILFYFQAFCKFIGL